MRSVGVMLDKRHIQIFLVTMWQSMCDNVTPPVGVHFSRQIHLGGCIIWGQGGKGVGALRGAPYNLYYVK